MISIIIPAFNEEARIGRCIGEVLRGDEVCEVIVADGGSSDRTVEIAAGYEGVRIVHCRRGRGVQMNEGAAVSEGKILLFLHADTLLEPGWSSAVLSGLEDSSVTGGAFTFAIDNQEKKYRLVEKWVSLRSFLFTLPYGDQGVFIRRDIFERLDGFADIPLMEDVDLIRRMKRAGRIVILQKKAFTSERRWMRKGLLCTAATNQLIMVLYRMGVSPQRLARIYYR